MRLFFYLIKKIIFQFFVFVAQLFILSILIGVSLFSRFLRKELFVFGSTPIINNKYWSESIKKTYDSITIMSSCYDINRKSDYDKYFKDFIPNILDFFSFLDGKYFALVYVLLKTSVLHTSFDGFALKNTYIEFFEPILLKIAKVKVIILPYGSDVYMYSSINDLSHRNVLIGGYPANSFSEDIIRKRIKRWIKYCDIFLSGSQFEGIPYWAVSPFNMLCIDLKDKKMVNRNTVLKDHKNSCIKIVHSTNHRFIKGTEFLIEAVESLKTDGYAVDLTILEGRKNEEVLEVLRHSDILADQFIMGYYGLSAIEGMALGLPVLCNMGQEYLKFGRRYSFLKECPIVSTNPENIKENLKMLIINPELREELSHAGRKFVEKYHSYKAAQYMFGSIYDKIIKRKDVDLMNLYHPILSEYNKSTPFVKHPLINNQIPSEYFKRSS